ncbi:TLDc domain protein (macronuclear) [Tetrahymena thermophila SB210]|uniref:TLDc domain protein n=1 Tax=Tetrahymena thermophila (strain SB210) TaxID=312017 RepID=Q24DM8_TETTS|nr:TLDc domain protein [Tetrahymena thermophila SB210]EAS05885.1 TLDc domain protein [Tetrahymena thermophila SB210]|eukprot:XP_001026130.1 TLDc domain protein [Tetrahymena thermophila SB210]
MGSLRTETSDSYTPNEDIFKINYEEKGYMVLLEINNQKLQITIMLEELCQFKWMKQFTLEELQNINKIFNMFDDVEQSFQPFQKWFKSYIQNLKIKGNSMYVTFNFELDQTFQVQFIIQLNQCDLNWNEIISQLSQKIVNLEKKSEHQKDLLEKFQQQSNKEIEQFKESHLFQVQQVHQNLQKQLQEYQQDSSTQINLLKNEITLLKPKQKFSKILYVDEIEMIKNWINKDNTQMNLELIYRASEHGFTIQKLYERCVNRTPLILVVKTTLKKRFGFYTDQAIKDYGGQYLTQNPNNLFIFSLDLKQKYTSNDSNNSNAFYSNSGHLALGGGHDFALYSNSIDNASSYNAFSGYGKNQGVSGRGILTGGAQNFTTIEIEIFQIKRI